MSKDVKGLRTRYMMCIRMYVRATFEIFSSLTIIVQITVTEWIQLAS